MLKQPPNVAPGCDADGRKFHQLIEDPWTAGPRSDVKSISSPGLLTPDMDRGWRKTVVEGAGFGTVLEQPGHQLLIRLVQSLTKRILLTE